MFKLGLTGSIGMGKSTTAAMFVEEGCALWDADAAVHRLYSREGAAVGPMRDAFPEAVSDGEVSRDALKSIIARDPNALKMIESIVHPLVRADRETFTRSAQSDISVFDIPLLFETASEAEFDAVACVYVDAETQRQRVLARGTMTKDQLDMIISKQIPAAEKKRRADYVIRTDTMDGARLDVQSVVEDIRGSLSHA